MIDTRDPSVPRPELLTNFVHEQIRYAEEEKYSSPGQLYRSIFQRHNKPMLGEFIKAKAGRCRKISLVLHQVLAKTGKENNLVTGYIEAGGAYKHAWVEYIDTKTGVEIVPTQPIIS